MTITEYKRRVIDLFRSGRATHEQWDQMAEIVSAASECDGDAEAIDRDIMSAEEFDEHYESYWT